MGQVVTLSTLGSRRSLHVESQHSTRKMINKMKAKWNKIKEELLRQLELRKTNEKLMENRMNNLEHSLMNLAGYHLYMDSMDCYFPETLIINFNILYLVSYKCMCIKINFDVFFCRKSNSRIRVLRNGS